MKNILLAFFISFIIHILFLVNYNKKEPIEKKDNFEDYKTDEKENITKVKLLKSKIFFEKENLIQEKNENLIQEKTLEKFLSEKNTINKEILSQIEEIYKEEYKNLTKVQKAYLEKNFNNFQIITQRVLNRLGYPREAIRLKLSGINTVEFYFYPNGDISELKIINSSGYSIFDNYTLELIKIAYKDYPRPETKTKLRFNVLYRFY